MERRTRDAKRQHCGTKTPRHLCYRAGHKRQLTLFRCNTNTNTNTTHCHVVNRATHDVSPRHIAAVLVRATSQSSDIQQHDTSQANLLCSSFSLTLLSQPIFPSFARVPLILPLPFAAAPYATRPRSNTDEYEYTGYLPIAAANEYLADYDRGEVTTQAMLRIMRRSGIIAGVNAPPAEIEEAPLETDTFLLLRLKAPPPLPHVEKNTQQSGTDTTGNSHDGSGGASTLLPSLAAGAEDGHHHQQQRVVNRLKIPRTKNATSSSSSLLGPPPNSPKAAARKGNKDGSMAAPGAAATGSAAPPPPAEGGNRSPAGASAGAGTKKRTGGLSRGKKRSSGAFEVDLLRFRGVEQLRAWKIGVPGGGSLAADFSCGACPRLSILRLGWCSLGDRGTCAIIRSLCGGGGASAAGRTLQELDLRGNAVTAVGLRILGGALAQGGLPALRALDLGCNSLRDEGGRAVAHRLLAGAGTWRRLAKLDLSANSMGDGGVEAVYKAVSAPGVRLAADVEMINVRNNSVSSTSRQRMSALPSFLLM